MLNILKNFSHNNFIKYYINNKIKNKNKSVFKNSQYKNIIYYPSSSKEWVSTIYSYNKSYIKPLIVYNAIVNKLFWSYFNMLQYKIKILYKRRRHNKNRYSANKIYVSKSELKHINTKLIIILYVFNKQKISIVKYIKNLITLTNIYKIFEDDKKYTTIAKYKQIDNTTTAKNKLTDKNKTMIISEKGYISRYKTKYLQSNRNKFARILDNNFLFVKKWHRYINFFKVTDNFLQYLILKIKKQNIYKISIHNLIYINKNYIIQKLLIDYSKWIYFNRSKFNNLVLNIRNLGLISLIGKLYNKKIEIRLIELKSIHLNSDIFSDAVGLKLRKRQNNMYNILRKAIVKIVKIPEFNTLITFDTNINTVSKNNILTIIKQQVVSGVRFEASGRLTRRLTAMRSIFKYNYAGSLKNIRCSFSRKPSTMLRGYVKSNSQYSIVNSKTRNGTFGLKSWISSH